ncbi:hypothetical protein [Novibacillus thermophilus]|uniref:Uncharacterized protein n=1 Tax=Novibacillus thermophilus TaxID=1471761 RepID=A0A1U9K6M5_9BACL|nr:hypothetical protein [Novibacillus thermophilus]AQS55681.1 hypothetical protein B0W44_07650 [Novibacillus thermophilus]
MDGQPQGYQSPFSITHDYRIVWRKRPDERLNLRLMETRKLLIQQLYQLRCATKVQLAKLLKPHNIRVGKKLVTVLKYENVITQHFLYDQKTDRIIPFYTLSPPIVERKGFKPLEKDKVDKEFVLKRLVMAQFLSRFHELGMQVSLLPFPFPFDGALSFPSMSSDFRVAIVRRSIQPVIHHFRYHDEKMRTLIVVERLSHAAELAELETDVPIRVTVDYHLLKTDLSESFYSYRKGEGWIREINPSFRRDMQSEKTGRGGRLIG